MKQAEPERGESSPWKGRICKFDRRINLASHWEFVDFRNESSGGKEVRKCEHSERCKFTAEKC